MIFEMTYQVRVNDFNKGLFWYKSLLNREPDFVPHQGFAEWELIPGSWLQLAEGIPANNSGPLRFGVEDIEAVEKRLIKELGIVKLDIQSREEVPVKWASFSDPWGNQLGFFEYLDKVEQNERIKALTRR